MPRLFDTCQAELSSEIRLTLSCSGERAWSGLLWCTMRADRGLGLSGSAARTATGAASTGSAIEPVDCLERWLRMDSRPSAMLAKPAQNFKSHLRHMRMGCETMQRSRAGGGLLQACVGADLSCAGFLQCEPHLAVLCVSCVLTFMLD